MDAFEMRKTCRKNAAGIHNDCTSAKATLWLSARGGTTLENKDAAVLVELLSTARRGQQRKPTSTTRWAKAAEKYDTS